MDYPPKNCQIKVCRILDRHGRVEKSDDDQRERERERSARGGNPIKRRLNRGRESEGASWVGVR
jgi:hypothetical protein